MLTTTSLSEMTEGELADGLNAAAGVGLVLPRLEVMVETIFQLGNVYRVDNALRLAHFLAQCAHETGGFTWSTENLNYRADSLMRVWPNRFKTLQIANEYAHQPEKIANFVYANRMGNGDESSGDGWRYRGRGWIQLTGRENYSWFAEHLNFDDDEVVTYMTTIEGSICAALWFWDRNGLNEFADEDDVREVTRRINGGFHGLADREARLRRVKSKWFKE